MRVWGGGCIGSFPSVALVGGVFRGWGCTCVYLGGFLVVVSGWVGGGTCADRLARVTQQSLEASQLVVTR